MFPFNCNAKASWATFAGLLLLSFFAAEARHLDSPLDGPRRRLLAIRKISGTVKWLDNVQAISGAVIKAWDNDSIGREIMGSTTTGADGKYVITYTVKNWDSCCFGATNPDPYIEVWIGSRLYYSSAENSDVTTDIVINAYVARYVATGSLNYYETCAPAVGATATLKDSDTIGDEFMGAGTTNALGAYTVYSPKLNDGSNWDLIGSNPDPFVEFKGPFGVVGKTATKSDVNTFVLNYGLTTLWRGDTNSSAKAIKAGISDPGPQDYISVVEYNHCSPKRMIVTIAVDIGTGLYSPPPAAQLPHLKLLLKQGIKDNWSRTGVRALNVAGKGVYDVYVNVVESGNGYPVTLKWSSKLQKDCERSNNPGIPVLASDLTLWYNEGCVKYANPNNAGWAAIADGMFSETAGHEWGHTVLQHAVNLVYSWTHKGSSTIWQNPSDSATNYPATGDIDTMLYYKNGSPPAARTFATDLDVRRLISIAKNTYAKYCGACPIL